MNVELKFSKGRIMLRAKDETFLAARSMFADKDGSEEKKFNIQAGDSDIHERKLMNSLGLALSELKSDLYMYDVTDTMTEGNDSFLVEMQVSDRLRPGRANDLQRLVEEYLYRKVVSDWWLTNVPEMASQYAVNTASAMDSIIRCLSLSKPYESMEGARYRCLTRKGFRILMIYKEELMNEFNSEMLKLSKARSNERGVADMNLQTNELNDESLITRYINRHIHRAGERMNAYLHTLTSTVDNDSMERVPVYEYRLVMPEGWDGRLFEQLAEEVHAYVVNASLAEWLKTVIPDMAPVYGGEAEAAYANIKHVLTVRRPGIIRKPIQPF